MTQLCCSFSALGLQSTSALARTCAWALPGLPNASIAANAEGIIAHDVHATAITEEDQSATTGGVESR
jgi:hypothetical protein